MSLAGADTSSVDGAAAISEHIRVYCRQKPELPEDINPSTSLGDNASSGVYLTGAGDKGDSSSDLTWSVSESTCRYVASGSKSEQTFKFDGVLPFNITQETVLLDDNSLSIC